MAENEVKVWLRAKDEASGALKKVAGALKGIAVAWLSYKGVKALADGLRDCVNEAQAAENATALLNAALKQQGAYTPEVAKDLQNFAKALQATTTHGDDAIMSVTAMLAQFGVAPEYLKEATKATVGWADLLGKDLKAAALDVAKAHEGNVMMLQRYGVRIDAATLQSEGFNAVLKAMNEKIGDVSQTLASTFEGRMKQLGNLIGDVKEEIGMAFTNSAAWREMLQIISEQVANLIIWLEKNRDTVQLWSKNVLLAVLAVAKTFADVVGVINTSGATIVATALDIAHALTYVQQGIQFTPALAGQFENTRKELKELKESVLNFGASAMVFKSQIDTFITNTVERIGVAFSTAGDKAEESGKKLDKGFGEAIKNINQKLQKTDAYMRKIFDWLWQWVPPIKDVSDKLKGTATNWDFFVVAFEEDMKAVLLSGANQLADTLSRATTDWLTGATRALHEYVLEFMRSVAQMIIKALVLRAIMAALGMPGFPFFNKGGAASGKQTGGFVPGGAPYRDRVPAMLSPGEFVLQKKAVDTLGRESVERLNRGDTRALGETTQNNFTFDITLGAGGDARQMAYEFIDIVEREFPRMYHRAQRRRQL